MQKRILNKEQGMSNREVKSSPVPRRCFLQKRILNREQGMSNKEVKLNNAQGTTFLSVILPGR